MSRQCSRSGCSHVAIVTLSFQYARSLVWLDDLTPDREPHCYDLCEQHAKRLSPPTGWRLEDRRFRVMATESDVAEQPATSPATRDAFGRLAG